MSFWFYIIVYKLYLNIEKGHNFYYLYLLVESLVDLNVKKVDMKKK